jgi:hypothetical protein
VGSPYPEQVIALPGNYTQPLFVYIGSRQTRDGSYNSFPLIFRPWQPAEPWIIGTISAIAKDDIFSLNMLVKNLICFQNTIFRANSFPDKTSHFSQSFTPAIY